MQMSAIMKLTSERNQSGDQTSKNVSPSVNDQALDLLKKVGSSGKFGLQEFGQNQSAAKLVSHGLVEEEVLEKVQKNSTPDINLLHRCKSLSESPHLSTAISRWLQSRKKPELHHQSSNKKSGTFLPLTGQTNISTP
jgi:tRNA(Glu) U13 pseudouridine synthase TruD